MPTRPRTGRRNAAKCNDDDNAMTAEIFDSSASESSQERKQKLKKARTKSKTSQRRYRERLKQEMLAKTANVEEQTAQVEENVQRIAVLKQEIAKLQQTIDSYEEPSDVYLPWKQDPGVNSHCLRPRVRLVFQWQAEFSAEEVGLMPMEQVRTIMEGDAARILKLHDDFLREGASIQLLESLRDIFNEKHGFSAYCVAHSRGLPTQTVYRRTQVEIPTWDDEKRHQVMADLQLRESQKDYILWNLDHFQYLMHSVCEARACMKQMMMELDVCDHVRFAQLVQALRDNTDMQNLGLVRFNASWYQSEGLDFIQLAKLWAATGGRYPSILNFYEIAQALSHKRRLVLDCDNDSLRVSDHLPDPIHQHYVPLSKKFEDMISRYSRLEI